MTGQQVTFQRARSIAGAALVGFGIFILSQNLAEAAVQLREFLGANGLDLLGLSPAVLQAASQIMKVYASDHQQFLAVLVRQMLISAWPLLLVLIGAVLSWEGPMDNLNMP
jgi:hypothetical protein